MTKRFFVTIIIPEKSRIRYLGDYGMDLFQQTLKASDHKNYTIEGLLTLEEVERLVTDGYKVLVDEELSKRTQGRQEITDFQSWLKGMEV